MARRKIDQIVKAAVLEELREGTPAKELSVKYGIAESTISRWRHAEGIDDAPYVNAVIRSKPLKVKPSQSEASDASAERREMIRHMVSLVTDLATGGGLKSHDIKNLSQAAKVLSEADQREQQLLEQELAKASGANKNEIKRIPTALGEMTIPNIPFFSDIVEELEHDKKMEAKLEQEYRGEGLA